MWAGGQTSTAQQLAWWDSDGDDGGAAAVGEVHQNDKSFLQKLPFHPELPHTRIKANARARLRKMLGGTGNVGEQPFASSPRSPRPSSVSDGSLRGHALDRLVRGLADTPAAVVEELLGACPVTSKADVPSNEMIMRAVSRIEALTTQLSLLDATDGALQRLRQDELVLLYQELERAHAMVAERCQAK